MFYKLDNWNHLVCSKVTFSTSIHDKKPGVGQGMKQTKPSICHQTKPGVGQGMKQTKPYICHQTLHYLKGHHL